MAKAIVVIIVGLMLSGLTFAQAGFDEEMPVYSTKFYGKVKSVRTRTFFMPNSIDTSYEDSNML